MQVPDEKSGVFIGFVSYSHKDTRWARWLHRSIEAYRLPTQLAKALGTRRVGRVFLDRSELSTSTDLSQVIQAAMNQSENLLVVCSPAARASRWVNEEVRRFRDAGKGGRIFCLIVDGDPAATDDTNCFPSALIEPSTAGGAPIEPLAADVRPGKDSPVDAKLKLISGLLDVPFDALKRRDQARRQRILVGVATVSTALLVLMLGLTTFALISRQEAVRQRDTAQRTVGFLRDLFDGARPDSAAGREITVREMVDRAAASAVKSSELRQEPEVRASLLTTLADVYAKLQQPAAGRSLIREAARFPISDKSTNLYRKTVEVNLLSIGGDFDQLPSVLTSAFSIMESDGALSSAYGPQLLISRAQWAQHQGRMEDAERDYAAARRVALAATPPHREVATTALLIAATNDVDAGRIARGETRLHRVISEYEAAGRVLDPDVLTAYNSLGAIAIKRGDPALAESWFRRALVLQQRVFGNAGLEVALSRSNLGRALVEQRRFADARASLRSAQATYLKEVGERADVLANLEDSLGLALAGLNQHDAAAAAYSRGLVAARANDMPKEVELLTDLAELRCATGQVADAKPLLDDARKALAKFELPEPWRKARIDSVEGGCLVASGRKAEAAQLVATSTPLVVARWGENSLFGRAARQRALLAIGR